MPRTGRRRPARSRCRRCPDGRGLVRNKDRDRARTTVPDPDRCWRRPLRLESRIALGVTKLGGAVSDALEQANIRLPRVHTPLHRPLSRGAGPKLRIQVTAIGPWDYIGQVLRSMGVDSEPFDGRLNSKISWPTVELSTHRASVPSARAAEARTRRTSKGLYGAHRVSGVVCAGAGFQRAM